MRIFQKRPSKVAIVFMGLWVALRLLEKRGAKLEGRLLGVPYDFRTPRLWRARLRASFWNPKDTRIFTPHFFGWGWSINFFTLFRRLGFLDFYG